MAKKIAPTLQMWSRNWCAALHETDIDRARRELRALLAAVGTLKSERAEVLRLASIARGTHQGELDGNFMGRMLEDSSDRIGKALARLERAGKEER